MVPQVSVGDTLVTLMTHPEIVSFIRTGAGDTELRITVERGDHIVPNIREAFPVKTEQDLDQVLATSFCQVQSHAKLHIKGCVCLCVNPSPCTHDFQIPSQQGF